MFNNIIIIELKINTSIGCYYNSFDKALDPSKKRCIYLDLEGKKHVPNKIDKEQL